MATRNHTHTDPTTLAAWFADQCDDAYQEKNGAWRARCPCHHGESNTSLHITTEEDRILLTCFAGCETRDVMQAMGLTMADLFIQKERSTRSNKKRGPIVQVYDYYDAHGTLVHQTVRHEPKAFTQRRPNLDPLNPDNFIWEVTSITTVLYHLPDVLQAIRDGVTIYVVEGEKDADALTERGYVATCNPMGAGKWEQSYSETLQDAHVVILQDYDLPGKRHTAKILQTLPGYAADIKVIDVFHTKKTGSDIADWIEAGGKREQFEAIIRDAKFYQTQPPPLGWSANGTRENTLTAGIAAAWRKNLFSKKNGELTQNYFNVIQILKYHDYWQQPAHLLWFDTFKQLHMCGQDIITKAFLVQCSEWFGQAERLPLGQLDLLRDCLYAKCEESPRDPLQHWVNNLPSWDNIPRLNTWLHTTAGAINDVYTYDVSRVLLVGMIARALNPGCPNRYVVILRGDENTGKSALVRAIASPEWYYAMKSDFESKEAHMEIQGSWVAELPELDSLNRTDETRLKAFITLLDDSWIPKYANDRITIKRRTVFVGTTNEETFLKGQTGNTRFVPIKTETIDIAAFEKIRTQLFAEARRYYESHPDDWWMFSEEGRQRLEEERDARRRTTPFEDLLHSWLLTPLPETFPPQLRTITTWEEIATDVLKIPTPERWKDKGVQMDIANAMRALGWVHTKRRVAQGDPPKWVYDAPDNWGVPF